jgi:hypothetical protein
VDVEAQSIFSGNVGTGSFTASAPFALTAGNDPGDPNFAVLDFHLDLSAPTKLEWYLEFTFDDPTDPAARWAKEIAEEDTAGGTVNMPIVLRAICANGGGNLPAGLTKVSAQLERKHTYARVQLRATSGSLDLNLYSVLGGEVGESF